VQGGIKVKGGSMNIINFTLWAIVLLIAAGRLASLVNATRTAPWVRIYIPWDIVAALVQFVVLIVLACLYFNEVM
jgi:hypothetical protein